MRVFNRHERVLKSLELILNCQQVLNKRLVSVSANLVESYGLLNDSWRVSAVSKESSTNVNEFYKVFELSASLKQQIDKSF